MTTVTVLLLLAVIAVGLLSLSSVSVRASVQGSALAEARANARLALMIALGELQKEMGPDMRVSAQAALFDEDEETPEIEGVSQPGWMASYDSWGDWLNNSYEHPETGDTLTIQDTYEPRRDKMFRRWLVSLPSNDPSLDPTKSETPLEIDTSNDENWVSLVDEGTLGTQLVDDEPQLVTRAYMVPIKGQSGGGKHAWWVSPENHKAKINLAARSRDLAGDAWETSQGDTAEVGVGGLDGFEDIDEDEGLSERLITRPSLDVAGVDPDRVRNSYFDVTASSRGVLTSVRTGSLKKDLSLLFERNNNQLPSPYRFNIGRDDKEPSIRPMSPDLVAKRPQIPNRHFASWTNMRHYYRMYRGRDTDATVGEMDGPGTITWERGKPLTECVATTSLRNPGQQSRTVWDGSNNYWRMPILAKITFIYSLQAVPNPNPNQRGKYDCYHLYSPVLTYWNPYNVELRVPDDTIQLLTSAYKVWPNSGNFYEGNTLKKSADELGAFGQFGYSQGIVTRSILRSGSRGDIIFKPGEFKVFSHASQITNGGESNGAGLFPGFDPQAIGGERKFYGTYSPSQNPGIQIEFSHNYWGGNINYGNTCGSLCMVSWWNRDTNPYAIPINYAHDWLTKAERKTPMTQPGTNNIARWFPSDGAPVPVAFCQLVLKGLSEFNYESIRWDRDWRSRNWIQAPPFYFGSGTYISEDSSIAHTQRIDCPYVVFFGPTSMAEMPKVVGHVNSSAFYGAGSNPFEKVTSIPALELPTVPVGSLAGFSNMRINPGWVAADKLAPHLNPATYSGNAVQSFGRGESLYASETKRVAYQSGVTGPGIGNSFIHPMIPRTDIYRYVDNSKSQDILDRSAPDNTTENDTKAYSDYWDHVFLLNDALWDDYFVSSIADQKRPRADEALSLNENLQRLVKGEPLANSRYVFHQTGQDEDEVIAELSAADGYLKAAAHLMVDGMFNVNSTSEDAWYALFAGIRERRLVYRDRSNRITRLDPPPGKRIAISRFTTETAAEEMDDPETGIVAPDGTRRWSGVRFLDDKQLLTLAKECVKQVKQRGPFLNYAEFINRRLSNDELGLMGALQSAIDYDDDKPERGSINFIFKDGPDFMMEADDLGNRRGHVFATPEAVEGSRFAGIPGYVIQSDILRPISNTLSVRDDTFVIRAYGESSNANGDVLARAWCEAVVQRLPEYHDAGNDAEEPARTLSSAGVFSDNTDLTAENRRFGRRFIIESFRWLAKDEV